jgi:hypothetical protein
MKYALHICLVVVVALSFTVFQLSRDKVHPAELGIPEDSYVDSTITYKTEKKGDSIFIYTVKGDSILNKTSFPRTKIYKWRKEHYCPKCPHCEIVGEVTQRLTKYIKRHSDDPDTLRARIRLDVIDELRGYFK